MSRYSLKPLPNRTDLFEVAVGWDAGLGTYFAIVFGVPEGDCDPVITSWQGRTLGQIPFVSALEDAISSYAALPNDVLANLEADKYESQILPQPQFAQVVCFILGLP